MAIEVKNLEQLKSMRKAGLVVADTLELLKRSAQIGMTTLELDEIAAKNLVKHGATSSFLGYHGFPAVICASVNEEVVHGIPNKRKLVSGDLLSIDFGAIVEGWHGDGNFARTSIMYCLWKTQGIVPLDWDDQLSIGAVQTATGIKIAVSSPIGWKGKLKFDVPRHSTMMHYPADYPRINQYQEWFVVEKNQTYELSNIGAGTLNKIKGSVLAKGLEVEVKAGETIFLEISSH